MDPNAQNPMNPVTPVADPNAPVQTPVVPEPQAPVNPPMPEPQAPVTEEPVVTPGDAGVGTPPPATGV